MLVTDRIRLFQIRISLTYYKYGIQFVSPFILNMIIKTSVDSAWRTEKVLDSLLLCGS
jgi:hypothetical protein